jgi:hypothetical protein
MLITDISWRWLYALLLILRFVYAELRPELVERCIILGVLADTSMPRCSIPCLLGAGDCLDSTVVV